MSDVKKEMPVYQSHKKVWALKIKDMTMTAGKAMLIPKDESYEAFFVDDSWISKYKPTAVDKGYYVVYKDGYASWSPSEAFEEGYTEVKS